MSTQVCDPKSGPLRMSERAKLFQGTCSKLLYVFLSVLLCLSMRDVEQRCFFNVLLKFFEWNMLSKESVIYV